MSHNGRRAHKNEAVRAGNRITPLFTFLCSRVLRKYERVRRKFTFPSRIHGDAETCVLLKL